MKTSIAPSEPDPNPRSYKDSSHGLQQHSMWPNP
ncbi:Uncharacterised protein [Listeria newyorkensis]|nr:Uncharacterised protein [Listeria newyorkensis]